MTPKLLLHIGYPKTGTTSLQQFLSQNFEVLKSRGILYPQAGRIHNAHYRINFSLGLGKSPEVAPEERGDLHKAIWQEVAAAKPALTIISSEYFITADNPALLQKFFRRYDTRVIVYLRRHDKALESAYAQAVKTVARPPWTGFDSFVDFQLKRSTTPYDYLGALRKWADVFGKDKLIVRPLEKGQNVPDIYRDFFDSIGVPWFDGLVLPPNDSNVSLSAKMVDVIDMVQHTPTKPEIKQKIVNTLVHIDGKLPREPAGSRFSPSRRAELLDQYAPSYREIAIEFLGRPDGDLFREPMPAKDEAWTPVGAPTSVEAVDLLLRAVAPMLKEA